MDAFFASVELQRRPGLRGLPVVVGGSRAVPADAARTDAAGWPRLREYAGRGVVTTATYEARAFGVHSGMGLMKAAQLAPEAILLPADFEAYKRASRAFKAAVAAIAPVIEDRGIDEIYVDLTDVPGAQAAEPGDDLAGARALAQRLQQAVAEATGLSCSIGITPNKLLSKLASELDKPRGITLLTAADIPARIWPLPARSLNGIGPKAAAKLAEMGLHTLGELAQAEVGLLVARFGDSYGRWLHEAAHGRDDRPVVTHREPKSISRETTFERDLHPRTDRAQLGERFTRLCEQLAADLARKGVKARNIGVKLRFDDFRTVTRELSLPQPVATAADIRLWAGRCLKRAPLERRLRLLGVRAGAPRPADEPDAAPPPALAPLPLFADL
jgi:DNA polymerase-4